jgi:predicted transcriptional regulator
MSGIQNPQQRLGPDAQRILDLLSQHPNQQFEVDDVAQQVGCSEETAQTALEALAFAGEIDKQRTEGGVTLYTRPRKT